MAPTTDPGRAIAIAVPSDWPVPTHSRAASTPTPSVSSRTALVASSPRSARMSVAPNERARACRAGLAEGDDAIGAEPPRCKDRAESHGPIPHDADHASFSHAGAHGRVVARAHHI